MVEEPESHIHPLNIEVVFQSLSSVYEGQVLISTHSPTVLAAQPILQPCWYFRAIWRAARKLFAVIDIRDYGIGKGKWISPLFTPPECWVERTEI